MSETYELVTVKGEGFTLSRIIWRRFRAPMPGLHERTLEHNPGLADFAMFLPVGTKFELVIPGADEEVENTVLRRLWGVSE
jgi:phage tail protein X